MGKSAYEYISESWESRPTGFRSATWHRLIAWRRGASFTRVEKPMRVDRARALGYKAKQGFVVVRARVRRGGLHKTRFDGARKPTGAATAVNRMTMEENVQSIAEKRTAKRYPNMQVLNSYYVGEDGTAKYYEVILVDAYHPSIASDPDLRWLLHPANTKRVFRGKTSAGQKHRGLRWKGQGSEHARPSKRQATYRLKDKDERSYKRRKHT